MVGGKDFGAEVLARLGVCEPVEGQAYDTTIRPVELTRHDSPKSSTLVLPSRRASAKMTAVGLLLIGAAIIVFVTMVPREVDVPSAAAAVESSPKVWSTQAAPPGGSDAQEVEHDSQVAKKARPLRRKLLQSATNTRDEEVDEWESLARELKNDPGNLLLIDRAQTRLLAAAEGIADPKQKIALKRQIIKGAIAADGIALERILRSIQTK